MRFATPSRAVCSPQPPEPFPGVDPGGPGWAPLHGPYLAASPPGHCGGMQGIPGSEVVMPRDSERGSSGLISAPHAAGNKCDINFQPKCRCRKQPAVCFRFFIVLLLRCASYNSQCRARNTPSNHCHDAQLPMYGRKNNHDIRFSSTTIYPC